MPELPEVETVRRGLEPAMLSQAIESVTLNRKDLRVPIPDHFDKVVSQKSIHTLIRRGKYILGFVEGGEGFVLHLGMSGRIHIHMSPEDYEPAKHDHVVFNMIDGARIVFNDPRRFGMLYLTHEDCWCSEKPFDAMGPEPLGNDFNAPALLQRLKNKRVNIKNALLDQRVVAGLGNIYVCEALYQSGIHPQREAGSINMQEAEKLVDDIRDVLSRALASGGSSLRDYKHTDGSLGYFQHSFSVYDREGERCKTCTDAPKDTGYIKRIVQSGRSTFFCENCQV